MDALELCYQTEVHCVELILEFLICHNLHKTLISFKNEIELSDFPWPQNYPKAKERINKAHVPLLTKLLDNEDHVEFFEKWTSLVPNEIQAMAEYKKLTIYLYTYFATIQYRNNEWNNNWEQFNYTNKNEEISVEKEAISSTPLPESVNGQIQKLDKTNGTFIIEKPNNQEGLPVVEPQENITESKQEEISGNEESKDEEDESSNREFERDSLENESDSNNDTDSTDLIRKTADNESAMDMFKKFLSEHGSQFSNDPEFLPFFALPFVENPKLHPTFTKVFEENWLHDLRKALQEFLINYSCGDAVIPQLVKLCLKNKSINDSNNENLQPTVDDENVKRLKEAKRKLHKLKKDHQKLVGVASELSSALEKSVQGEAVNLKSTLTNCVKIFPDLFPNEVATHQPIKWQTWEKNDAIKDKKLNYNQIDVRKLKQDLISGSVKNKLLLLQALRWYITKCPSEEREHIVSWFCRQDLLGLKTNFISDSLAPTTSPHPIQQSVVRILNALASFNAGRDYIGSSKVTVQLLIDITKLGDLDSVTEDMIVATLQKLSLRRRLSDLMVENDILKWLLDKIDPGPLKKYTLEYSTSLIMNLSICIAPSFWDNREQSIYSLIKLLKTSHNQVVEFVCGTLCCIVRSDLANNYCSKFGLDNFLTECLNNHKGNVTLEKQIETLIRLHHREISPDNMQFNSNYFSDDDLEDPEELESEIDENDLVKGTPAGENLLSEHYSTVFTAPSIVGRQWNKSPKLFLRPSTPRSNNNVPSWARSDF